MSEGSVRWGGGEDRTSNRRLMREFTDTQGKRWLVYTVGTAAHGVDVSRRYLPDEYRQGWLAFESGERKLRLAPVPSGWDELTDAQLRELLAQARPTESTRPTGHRAFGAPDPDDQRPR
jgi:hypothetical protein